MILCGLLITSLKPRKRHNAMQLILYRKPDCHLCEGLEEKLEQVTSIQFDLERRDITTREDWFNLYQYEIPVLCLQSPQGEKVLPRLSPRATVKTLEQLLEKNIHLANLNQ
jgi:hypothetical protein